MIGIKVALVRHCLAFYCIACNNKNRPTLILQRSTPPLAKMPLRHTICSTHLVVDMCYCAKSSRHYPCPHFIFVHQYAHSTLVEVNAHIAITLNSQGAAPNTQRAVWVLSSFEQSRVGRGFSWIYSSVDSASIVLSQRSPSLIEFEIHRSKAFPMVYRLVLRSLVSLDRAGQCHQMCHYRRPWHYKNDRFSTWHQLSVYPNVTRFQQVTRPCKQDVLLAVAIRCPALSVSCPFVSHTF